MRLKKLEYRIKNYVYLETGDKVKKIIFVQKFSFLGQTDAVFLVSTENEEWWVVGGASPINLYQKSKLNSADEAFSFHLGIVHRISERQIIKETNNLEDFGYDAFICHVSEDKKEFVRPLAKKLNDVGVKVWYDEFCLKLGDSLRRSIDHGLANSRFGIVVLSKKFFLKKWPQYELDGLTEMEIEGESVIIPIWYKIDKKTVLKYSPPLADKVAADTRKSSIQKIAMDIKKEFPKSSP